ncbi:alcohol dehydrogenase [Fusarium albosuccineum]|uniref:Alcohol dehydrogenase n=1 Tax=Fusarium albosuccineum TaxID=1237068 RepID=A0A8H4PF49_9HYPO|nr:alcohol dehydrogenase [Fusarium albosuccineum]
MVSPVALPTRKLGKDGPEVVALGFGLMGLSAGYGTPEPDEDRLKVLDRAWEIGATNWDTSDAYGDSEVLVGKWFALRPERRQDIFLATKFGTRVKALNENPVVEFDTSPAYAREACERSLKRLVIESIDLYYIHRLDSKTPVEKTIEEMAKLKSEGKIKYLGISECTSAALRRAHAVHPIHAFQVEYNPWTLDIEGSSGTNLLQTTRGLGITTVAYSPLGRGMLTGAIKTVDDFAPDDHRRFFPRFQGENFAKNLELVDKFKELAVKRNVTPGQLALAWLLAQGSDTIPIPGTRKIKYLEENFAALKIELTREEEKEIRKLVDDAHVAGPRGIGIGEFLDSPEL